jgi:hypothetical protein
VKTLNGAFIFCHFSILMFTNTLGPSLLIMMLYSSFRLWVFLEHCNLVRSYNSIVDIWIRYRVMLFMQSYAFTSFIKCCPTYCFQFITIPCTPNRKTSCYLTVTKVDCEVVI